MPKLGQEPIRRKALVQATIAEIGATGSLSVTVGQIAKRAGMSTALAHHYFGGKDQMLHAGMRGLLRSFTDQVRSHLGAAETPRARVEAIIHASFDSECFEPDTIAAWLNFYVLAQKDTEAQRLLRVYQRRLHSNLASALRPLSPTPHDHAEIIAALIDGVYIRQALREGALGGAQAASRVITTLDTLIGAAP